MKKRTIIVVGLIGLAGLTYTTSLALAARDKPRPARSSAVLSREGREAIVTAAHLAVHQFVQIDMRERNGNKIPRRFWGEAIRNLHPLRVVDDRMNVMIVLTEDSRNEKGLYFANPISSYLAGGDDRFAAFEELSKPGDKSFGGLCRYHIRKKQSSTILRQ